MTSSVHVELPPAALRPLVVCAVRREITAGGEDAIIQANGYACISVTVRGEVQVAGRGTLPAWFVSGPFSRPVATQAQAPLLSMSVVLQPWLLPDLVPMRAGALVDRWHDLRSADARVGGVCEAAVAAALRPACTNLLWEALSAILPASAFLLPGKLALERLGRHGPAAAARSLGVSGRHYRRLFAEHIGLAPKLWQRTRRFESALLQLGDARAQPALGELALAAGYADQAHMNRDFRALVEQPPAGVRSGLRGEGRASWSLQPARVRFVQDGEGADS